MCVESRNPRPKGWLVCLAISKDLKTWEKKGPILDFGKPGSVCAERVTGMDFYPTFLEAAGLPLMPQQHTDDVSLLPVMSGTGQLAARPLVFHFPHYGYSGPNSTLVENDWKLIRFYNDSAGRFLLYDLAADPYELKDRSAEQPDKVRAMDARLSGLLKEMQAQLPVPNPNYDATRPAILTRQTALGMAAKKRLLEESQLRSLAAPSIDKNQDP